MSAYAINKVCHKLYHDDAFRQTLERAPDTTLAQFDLTQEEQRLLLCGEVGRLYELGAHPFLLAHLTRHDTFGVTVALYNQRMRAAKDDRIAPLEPAAYLAT